VAEVDALQKRFNDLGKGFNGPGWPFGIWVFFK
jgi:hypothetical protein